MSLLSRIYFRVVKKLHHKEIVNSSIHHSSKVEASSSVINSTFDRHSFCGYDCTIINSRVGPFVSIADSVSMGLSRHPMENVSMSPVFYDHRDSVKHKYSRHRLVREFPPVVIGADSWIGKGAFIAPGINIGVGSVIGMNSVVTKDVPPYSIVAGSPARLIRSRFSPERVTALLNSKWWLLDDSRLEDLAQHITDVDAFISHLPT